MKVATFICKLAFFRNFFRNQNCNTVHVLLVVLGLLLVCCYVFYGVRGGPTQTDATTHAQGDCARLQNMQNRRIALASCGWVENV